VDLSAYPYPKAVKAFPSLRQSLLSEFDNCGLSADFTLRYRRGFSTAPQSRGQIFHKVAAECLREMARQGEESIPVDAALAILRDVLRMDWADRVCPHCDSQDIAPGVSSRGRRRCRGCGKSFETELVNVSLDQVKDLYWVVIKWAHDNAWDIRNLVSVEQRIEANVRYPNRHTGEMMPRAISGKLDAVFLEDGDPTVVTVVDYKDMWSLPPPKEVSEGAYFQQRCYALLLFENFPAIERVILREQYVRYSETREAAITRSQAEEVESEMAALAERFDRAYEEKVWVPTSGKHCFSADTRFLTSRGVRTLGEAAGESVCILNRNGRWEDAVVRSFGVQPLLRVRFDSGDEVLVTPDHRWWQADGGRITTVELERAPLAQHAKLPTISSDGIRHGFTFGDGWRRNDRGTCVARFMPHDREIADRYFSQVRWRKRGACAGQGFSYGLPGYFKDVPVEVSPAYARGFIAGLLAADGTVEKTGGVVLYVEGEERARRVAEVARLGGCVVTSVKVFDSHRVPTNYSAVGTVERELATIRLKPATAPVIRSDHRARLKARNQMRRMWAEVVSIEPAEPAEVFCVVAPGSESFTLANGLVTSNCNFCIRPSACPIPVFARGEGRIIDEAKATQVAHQMIVAERVLKESRAALRAFADVHGPIPIRDAKGPRALGYVEKERTERPSLEEIEEAERNEGRPLSSLEVKRMYRKVPSTKFQPFTPTPQRDPDEIIVEQLEASLKEAS
jgi:hypothetical protein